MRANAIPWSIRAHPRRFIAAVLAVLTWLGLPDTLPGGTRLIVALDVGGVTFLALAWIMMAAATTERMRLRARLQDEGRATILLLTVGALVLALSATVVELHGLKDLSPSQTATHVALAGFTLVCSWLVTHTMFALHYAHVYYGDADGDPNTPEHRGGLDFPSHEKPDYWDFMYFAFVIGMTGQTSDVQITGRRLRRLGLAQGVLSFIFNTVILALTINIAASLL